MKKRLFIVCLVTLILSACESSSTAVPISSEASILDRPGKVEYVEAYCLYNHEYTPTDVRNDISVTDTKFSFHPVWLETPLEIDASDKNDIKVNGNSLNWSTERVLLNGEHTFRYSETDKHAYVAYSLRLPLDKKSCKQDVYAELYKQIRKFFKKIYDKSEIVLDTKTDFKRVIEADVPFSDFNAKWCYLWLEDSDLQFTLLTYYSKTQSSIDDFYYDD